MFWALLASYEIVRVRAGFRQKVSKISNLHPKVEFWANLVAPEVHTLRCLQFTNGSCQHKQANGSFWHHKKRKSLKNKSFALRAALVRKFYSFQEWHDLRVMPFLFHQFIQRDEPDQIIADVDALAAFSAAFIRSPDIDCLDQLMGRVRRQFGHIRVLPNLLNE